MANSVDPDQTAPIEQSVLGPRCLLLYFLVSNVRQLFAADDFTRRHFQMIFFLGALMLNCMYTCIMLELSNLIYIAI